VAFDSFDKDNDGEISVSELGAVMKAMGENLTEAQLQNLISEADDDGTGTINFNEFVKFISSKNRDDEAVKERELLDAFQVFDRDQNGFISMDELRHILTSFGHKFDEEELEDIMDEADADGESVNLFNNIFILY
jgi:calmodulin